MMGIFGKKSVASVGDLKMIDLHSHILPGIDDGAPDFDTSVALVRELASGGVTDVFATPHYVDETIYTSTASDNRGLLADLQEKVDAEGINVRLHLGNEIYIMPRIREKLSNGEISSLGGSSYLLVELPMSGEYPGYADIFLDLMRSGYRVVLAHPERYSTFQEDYALARELYDMGVLLQCNLGSFAGQYGKGALKLVEHLARERMIFAMGSDIHHLRGESFIPFALGKMARFYGADEMRGILVENPRGIIDGMKNMNDAEILNNAEC